MGKGRSVIFKSLESFFSKNQNQKGLTKKTLILDKINLNQDFFKEIKKIYRNNELSEYLTKYLTFWLKQENPYGPYFLDYFQDYSYDGDKYQATVNDVENFSSKFSHTEFLEMNNLPEDRKNIAVIRILGEVVKFKKINHFFNFIDFLNYCFYEGEEISVEDIVWDHAEDYKLTKYPNNKIIMTSFGNQSPYEKGFFHIDFDMTMKWQSEHSSCNSQKTNNNINQVLVDFFKFLNILDIEIKYTKENLIKFYQVLQKLKTLLLLQKFEEKSNRPKFTMSNQDHIYYIDEFLRILKKHTKTNKKLTFLNKFSFLPRILEISKNHYQNKMSKLMQKKWLILPIALLLFFYLAIRVKFYFWFFVLFALLNLVLIIKNKQTRNFPTFRAYIFDFRVNFCSRFTFSTLFNLLFFIRLFLFLPASSTYIMSHITWLSLLENASPKEKILGQTFAIIANNQANLPLVFSESALFKKKTSLNYNLIYNLINIYESQYRNKFLTSYIPNNLVGMARQNVVFPENLVQNFPWRDHTTALFPGNAITQSGKIVYSSQEHTELIIPWILGQGEILNFTNGPSTIFENNPKNNNYRIAVKGSLIKIEGEIIIDGSIIQEVKQLSEQLLIDPTHKKFIFKEQQNPRDTNFLFFKTMSALQLNRGYEVVLFLDLTHLENPSLIKSKVDAAFKVFVEKYPEVFGFWNEKRIHIRYIDRIQHTDPEAGTSFINFVLSKKQKLEILLKEYNELLKIASQKIDEKSTNRLNEIATIFKELQNSSGFSPIEEIKRLGILEYCLENPGLEFLKKPLNFFSGVTERYIDRSEEITKLKPDIQTYLKTYDASEKKFNENLLKVGQENPFSNNKTMVPYDRNAAARNIIKNESTALVLYNDEFATKQKKRYNVPTSEIKEQPLTQTPCHTQETRWKKTTVPPLKGTPSMVENLLDKTGYNKDIKIKK